MTDVLPRGHDASPRPDERSDGVRFSLDDQTKQLLRLLVGDDRGATGQSGQTVDWDSIWSIAGNWRSEELALGSAVLAAEEAVVGEPMATPSALLVRARRGDLTPVPAPSELLVGARQSERGPSRGSPHVRVARPSQELPKGLGMAVAGATWVRNVGLIVVLFAVWQLWGTGIAEAHSQDHLKAEYALLVREQAGGGTSSGDQAIITSGVTPGTAASVGATNVAATPAVKTTTTPTPVKVSTSLAAGQAQGGTAGARSYAQTRAFVEGALPGGVLGRIRIPAVGVDRYFVEGVGEAQLQQGPGRYPGSGLPGQPGNLAIAGHRTTYGAPFFELDHVRVGDKVTIDVPQGRAIYTVSQPPFAVSPYDTTVLANFGDSRLTLTTCNPPFFATTRLIVVAELSEWLPTGARIPVTNARADLAHIGRTARGTSSVRPAFGSGAPVPVHWVAPRLPRAIAPAALHAPRPSRGAAAGGTIAKGTSRKVGGAGGGAVTDALTVSRGLADEGAGWHFGEVPLVLAVVIALAALGSLYGRVAKLFVGSSRWMVMVPMWAAGLLALFKVLGLLLPADL
jgi:LPXTG-site transpeptidase (sortase) family protein